MTDHSFNSQYSRNYVTEGSTHIEDDNRNSTTVSSDVNDSAKVRRSGQRRKLSPKMKSKLKKISSEDHAGLTLHKTNCRDKPRKAAQPHPVTSKYSAYTNYNVCHNHPASSYNFSRSEYSRVDRGISKQRATR